jgi:predicted RNA-binding Zn-ribbon protein involved in translation (DUF1610 family)
MPRARSKTTSRKATTKKRASAKTKATARRGQTASAASATTFTCPECGKTFTRAASLGAHRNRTHGVTGASVRNGSSRATRSGRANRGTNAKPGQRVDRDALLAALFPDGIPAKERVIREVNGLLDQAERLARLS